MSEVHVPAELRRLVAARACDCCEYCRSQATFATQSFAVEHIVPSSQGGETVEDNLALSCAGCNGHKYTKTQGRDPLTGAVVPLFHPRRHRWEDHFTWSDDFTRIIGLTPTGRATVQELHLNREGVVNLRSAVRALGRHPPPEPSRA